MHLRELIAAAYGVRIYQVLGGPGWLDTDAYNLQAKQEVSGKPEPDFAQRWADTFLRLQALLEMRGGLKSHRETKDLSAYALVVAKGGLKVQPPICVDSKSSPPPQPGQPRPVYCGATDIEGTGLERTFTGSAITMKNLIDNWLSSPATRGSTTMGDTPIVDRTGYTEKFNATVKYVRDLAPRPLAPDDASKSATADDIAGPSIFSALEKQLGLKLELTKAPIEVLVIDLVQRPSEN